MSNEDHFMKKYNAYGSASWSDVKKALILCILDFRRNEFMWEGLRWWDMMRYQFLSPILRKRATVIPFIRVMTVGCCSCLKLLNWQMYS